MAETLTMLDAAGRLAWQASWHGAVLAALVLVSMRLHIVRRALSPGWRSALWLLVGARLALPLAPGLPTSIHNLYGDPAARTVAADPPNADASRTPLALPAGPPEAGEHIFLNQPAPVPATASAVPQTTSTAGALAWRVALFGWLTGLMIVAIRYAMGAWRLQRIIDSCEVVCDEYVLYLADECRRECGLAARPALKRVPGAFGPTVAGFWRPTLLLSDATLRMDWRSLRFILLHEMRHIRTGDCRIAWLLRGLTAIHWFNPFCWLANRSWQAERELACDAWVLRHADATERRHYGQTLLDVVAQASPGDGALLATGMASHPRLLERRIRDMKRPAGRSRSQRAAAIFVVGALLLVGFADRARSQPAPTNTAGPSQPGPPAPPTKAAAKSPRLPKNRKKIFIVLAEHVILVRDAVTQNADLSEFRIVTWDQLLQLLREASKTARIVPQIYGTTGGFHQFEARALALEKVAKELKAPTWLMAFVQYDGSQIYDAIRRPDDLKPDPSRLREGTVRLANGQPVIGATVVLRTRGKYDTLIYINQTDLRDLLDEVWIKTDNQGRFHFYPKDDDFAVAALHPTGFGLATAAQLEKRQPVTLAPWGQLELKGNSETGLSATRTGEGKNAVRINLQAFSHTGHTVPMPAGRIWIQRLTNDKKTGDTLVVVGPGETKAVAIEPPAPPAQAKPDKDAKTKH
ncbi:MAG TPA: M56 family metallopeptidase [Planctomycetaceae bacterium]|nr:M56 family metallopeptidase [Planctomycetaceae bacterium]